MKGALGIARSARILIVAALLAVLGGGAAPAGASAVLPISDGGSAGPAGASPTTGTSAATAPKAPTVASAVLSTWSGGVDLYRAGVFTTQKTWRWCTAADVQIMRNIVDHRQDHSRAGQQRYYSYMRAHNRYPIPAADGVDPAGWTAGLRHYVDDRYRRVASSSFAASLRSAVTSLRRTNLPVGLLVAHGNHAWVLTGFTATADPARTSDFTVTSVRVVGPLWGLQSRTYGYDMRPDRKLTPAQLKGFFTPVALRAHPDGLGGQVGVDPADRLLDPGSPMRRRPGPTHYPSPSSSSSSRSNSRSQDWRRDLRPAAPGARPRLDPVDGHRAAERREVERGTERQQHRLGAPAVCRRHTVDEVQDTRQVRDVALARQASGGLAGLEDVLGREHGPQGRGDLGVGVPAGQLAEGRVPGAR